MWIMTNNSYLSIVSKDCGPAELLVRARRAGDIERIFPYAEVTRNTKRDYLYRAVLPRDAVKQALAATIDYDLYLTVPPPANPQPLPLPPIAKYQVLQRLIVRVRSSRGVHVKRGLKLDEPGALKRH